MKLLVDLGNSRLKWACAGEGVWHGAATPRRRDGLGVDLERVWGDMPPPDDVTVCSVAGARADGALAAWTAAAWSLTPVFVRALAAGYGVVNGYRDPAQLGADRWSALVAARGLGLGAVAVADCGTAVTVDAIDAQGRFVGGSILPGIEMARVALLGQTAGITEAGAEADGVLGMSTAEGVAGGVLFGLAGAVERLVAECESALRAPLALVLTGGDAARIAPRLRREARLEPDLVLRGLARMCAQEQP